MWAKIITIKKNRDLNYFSLCALNLSNTWISQFKLNYWNKWTFPRHSNLLRCTCIFVYNVQPVSEICVPLWVISMPAYYCDFLNMLDLPLNSALMTKSFTSQSNSLVLTIWVVLGQNNLQSRFDVYSQKSAANDLRGLLGLYPISISALLLLFGLVRTYTDWTGDMQPWGTPR